MTKFTYVHQNPIKAGILYKKTKEYIYNMLEISSDMEDQLEYLTSWKKHVAKSEKVFHL
jgi:hypothetical protein